MAEVPESVYLEAARADVAVYFADDPAQPDEAYRAATAERVAQRPDFRAAVKSAYAAGWSEGYGEGSNHGYQEGSGVRDW